MNRMTGCFRILYAPLFFFFFQSAAQHTVTDADGNIYSTVKLGNKVWMAENLRVTRYRNGDSIPRVAGDKEWEALMSGAWCDYNNDSKLSSAYGRLYNWFAVNDKRGICPNGWHIPSKDEFQALIDIYENAPAEGALKSADADSAASLNILVPPAGYRYYDGLFKYLGIYGGLWTATEGNDDFAWLFYLVYNKRDATLFYVGKKSGISCRCVKD